MRLKQPRGRSGNGWRNRLCDETLSSGATDPFIVLPLVFSNLWLVLVVCQALKQPWPDCRLQGWSSGYS